MKRILTLLVVLISLNATAQRSVALKVNTIDTTNKWISINWINSFMKYVDTSALVANYYNKTAADSRFVHLFGDEAISGNKSFNNITYYWEHAYNAPQAGYTETLFDSTFFGFYNSTSTGKAKFWYSREYNVAKNYYLPPTDGQLALTSDITAAVGTSAAGKLNITDTTGMLSNYFNKTYITANLATKQNTITLTTTGSTGAATLVGNTLNIPQYTGGGGGTVLSVAALTLTTTGTDLTSSVANGTSTPVITLNVPSASATNRGVLTSTDWSNFNTAYSNRITSLTTTGSSGAATLVTNTLNIPTYTLAGLGGISLTSLSFAAGSGGYNNTTGVITIPTNTSQLTNGAAFIPLTALSVTTTGSSGAAIYSNTTGVFNIPNYTLAGLGGISLTSLSGGTGINYNNTTGAITNSLPMVYPASGIAVSTGTAWGTSITDNSTNWNTAYSTRVQNGLLSARPVVGTAGRYYYATDNGIMYFDNGTTWSAMIGALTGDVTTTFGNYATTLATVNSNVGSFGNSTTVPSFTVNAKGLITAASSTAIPTATTSTTGLLTSTDWNTFNGKQGTITLTTTGTSGAATLVGNTLNIPAYTASGGSVTSVSVTTANGISGTVATATTTPAITLTLGAITPTSVNSVVISGSTTPTLSVTGTSSISGSNTGDNAVNSLYSGLVSNATHTGDATGSTALTVVRINGQSLAALATGILKNTTSTGVPTIAVAGTDYEVPLTFSTGLTRTTNTITVNTSQNISTLSNLTTNGLIKTSGGTGALSIATAGTDYQAVINGTGFVKATGTTISFDNSTYLTSTTGVSTFSGGTTGFTPNTATSGAITLAGTLNILNGGTGVTSVTTTPTASAWAGWDANKNISANNGINAFTTTATAAGTTTLTVGSTYQQYFTGATTQTVVLPVATTLVNGFQLDIVNNSTGLVTVQTSGANTVQALASNTELIITCINTAGGTGTASWSWRYLPIMATSTGVTSVATNTGSGITGGTITSTGTISADTTTVLSTKANVVAKLIGYAPLVSPSFTTPSLGVATATSINGNIFTTGSSTFTGTAAATYTFPTSSKTIAANDGSNLTIASQAIGDMLVATSTTAYGRLADVAVGSYLRSGGVGVAPLWSTLILPNAATVGDLMLATSANTITSLADAATGNALISGGAGVVPSYGKIGLTTHVSGTLPIANGGTNSATALSGSSIMVSNGSAIIQGALGTTTTVLHGNAAGTPTYSAVSLTADVTGTLPILNGGTNLTALPTTPAASTYAAWDANKNFAANNLIDAYTTTATAAGTTTLTVGSTYQQYFTGITTQTVVLPVVTTLVNGMQYVITNTSSGVVTVQTSGAVTVQALAPNTSIALTCINTAGGTGTASWNWIYSGINNTSLGSGATTANAVTFNNSGTGAASGTTFNGSAAQTISYNTVGAQQALTLTTTGTSGAATLSSGTLNIPNYAGSVTSVSVTTANGISGSVATATTTPAITLSLGAITPTSVNSVVISGSTTPTLAVTGTSSISGSNTGDNAVNSLYSGLVSNATHSGDATGSTVLTLATVNANVGSFGTSTSVPSFTVNAKGLITAASATAIPTANTTTTGLLSSTDWNTFNGKQPAGSYLTTAVTSVGGTGTVSGLTLSGTVTTTGNLTLGGTLAVTPSNFASQAANTVLAAPNGAAGVPTFRTLVAADIPALPYYSNTNPSGYITGITSGNVTTALGYTPYNATNPSGYITGITSGNVTTALGYTPYNATNPAGYISSYTETSTLANVTSRGATTATAISITNATASTTTATGALVISGGLGVGGSVYATSVFQTSDERLKNIISRKGDMITFTWKDKKDTLIHYGYGAQSIKTSYPMQVSNGETMAVNYIEILVKKVNDLENEIKELKKQLQK